MKRVILDADNELFKKTEPVLIDIWCRGIVGAKLTSIVLTMLFSLLLSPIGWISAAARKIIHFIIFGGIWYFVQLYLSHYLNNLDLIILYIGIVFILYKDLYKEVVILIIHLITLITFGLFVQWIARGYLNHSDVCHRFLTMDVFLNIIAVLTVSLPSKFSTLYNRVMDLYLDSNEAGENEELEQLISNYWDEIKQI